MGASRFLTGAAVLALVAASVPPSSIASENVTYAYDALGRLVKVQSSGSVNNNVAHSLCYDATGNRVTYASSTAGATATCAPTPAPTPTPTSTITASNPTLNLRASTTYTIGISALVTLNGANGAITTFSTVGGGSASIASGGQSVSYTTPAVASVPPCEPPNSVTVSIPYSVQNTANSQVTSGTATANIEGEVRSGICQ